ncbi:MAG: hypothetical protein WDN06_12140 [Asticcacaulis sp.]
MDRRAFIAALPGLALTACTPQALVPQEKRALTQGRTAELLAAAHAANQELRLVRRHLQPHRLSRRRRRA